MWIFYILISLMIIAALIAVETKNLLSAVICIGATGFIGSVMFLFLRAPDVAITQIAVEVLALVILIRATISRDKTFISGDREFVGMIISVVILFVIFLSAIKIFETLPEFGDPAFVAVSSMKRTASVSYIADSLEKTGAANIVSAVILDFRAYDTLGEATVLFTSILGAVVILREKSKHLLEAE
jgi:multicomponent Na+:H+ antiporter subunit B